MSSTRVDPYPTLDAQDHDRVVDTCNPKRAINCYHGRPMRRTTTGPAAYLGDPYCRLCEWEAPKLRAAEGART